MQVRNISYANTPIAH